jgi:LmbE family N-acetylglucosaminyl deacetylase
MSCIEAHYIPYHAEERIGRGNALIFAPHPDDEVFGCGGAILRHVEDGDAVRVIIVTDGAFGAGNHPHAVMATRQSESRTAARILGYGEPLFWGYPDRGLVNDDALVKRIRAELASFRPVWVYAPSWWEIHPDHTALSLAVTAAVRLDAGAARLVLYEIGMPLHPNCLLDITKFLECKRAAMACFDSQMIRQSYDSHVLALNRYRTYTLAATILAAEAYRVVEQAGWPRPIRAPLMTMVDALPGAVISQAPQGIGGMSGLNGLARFGCFNSILRRLIRGWRGHFRD